MKEPRKPRAPTEPAPGGEGIPLPNPPQALGKNPDPRLMSAWRTWLAALADDAEAALAASHLYADLSPDARSAWLDALAEDMHRIPVHPIAVYAPLLAVESDPERQKRIYSALGELPVQRAKASDFCALRGLGAKNRLRVAVLIAPLYLRFVRVLRCAYTLDHGFLWARHDLLILAENAPKDGDLLEELRLEKTPMKLVIEELSRAILAHRRKGAEPPQALIPFADLFSVRADSQSENKTEDDGGPF